MTEIGKLYVNNMQYKNLLAKSFLGARSKEYVILTKSESNDTHKDEGLADDDVREK